MKFNEGLRKPESQEEPDITSSEIEEIGRAIQRAASEKKIEDMSEEELARMGIKKTVGSNGEVIYNHGYSPDTGTETQEMHLGKVATEKREMTPKELEAAEKAREALEKAYSKASEEGTVGHLPSREELDNL
jgi:hypothetical protein